MWQATASIILPILSSVAVEQLIHPMRLLIPAGTATAFAFSLPAATPPNSVVFATGRVSIGSFFRNGVKIDTLAIFMCGFGALGMAIAVFDALGPFPEWACINVPKQCVWLPVPGVVDGRMVTEQACAIIGELQDERCHLKNGTVLSFSISDLPHEIAT